MAIACERPDPLRQFIQEVLWSPVDDGVGGVKAQTIDVVLFQPEQRVLQDKLTGFMAAFAVEVQRRSPCRLVLARENLWEVLRQVVSFGTEVVVHHIEHDHQSALMRGFNKALQIFGSPIGRVRGIQQDRVVAPVTRPRKVGDRHQFNGGYAKRSKMIKPFRRGGEGPFRREGADMQLI